MQKNEIEEFLNRIDSFLGKTYENKFGGEKFELRIFGKSALLLAGLTDSVGTIDIDLLQVESGTPLQSQLEIKTLLEAEFNRQRQKLNNYYLEFVSEAIVMLSNEAKWIPLSRNHKNIYPLYLDPDHIVGSKLFSAFAETPRKKDKQDIRSALDQGLARWTRVCEIADEIFEKYRIDARSDHFPEVYEYITKELMPDYGDVKLKHKN